jgi:plastocyanin
VGGGGGNGPAAVEKAGLLTIAADPTGALSFVTRKATGLPGKVTISMPNKSPIQHNIALKGDGAGPIVGSGGDSKFTATLKPGTYEFYCQVPGHEAAGMKGTLTVK